MSRTIDLGLLLVDHQLLDSEGRRCGNVDELALEGGPGEPLEVVAILTGLGALRGRAGWSGRFLAWLGGGRTTKSPWEDVEDVASHVKLRKRAQTLGLGTGDDRLRPYIEKIPGANR